MLDLARTVVVATKVDHLMVEAMQVVTVLLLALCLPKKRNHTAA